MRHSIGESCFPPLGVILSTSLEGRAGNGEFLLQLRSTSALAGHGVSELSPNLTP